MVDKEVLDVVLNYIIDTKQINNLLKKYNTIDYTLSYFADLKNKKELHTMEEFVEEGLKRDNCCAVIDRLDYGIKALDKDGNLLGVVILTNGDSYGYYYCNHYNCFRYKNYNKALPKSKYISYIVVSSEYQGKGLGTTLLNATSDILKHDKCSYVTLDSVYNDYVQKFYKTNRFHNLNDTENYEIKTINTELESLSIINTNILTYMINNKINNFDKLLKLIKARDVDIKVFTHGCDNYALGILRDLLSIDTKSKLLQYDKQFINTVYNPKYEVIYNKITNYIDYVVVHKELDKLNNKDNFIEYIKDKSLHRELPILRSNKYLNKPDIKYIDIDNDTINALTKVMYTTRNHIADKYISKHGHDYVTL